MLDSDSFLLRSMAEKDIKQVFEWRNSERIRQTMLREDVIVWDSHIAWFERVLRDTDKKYFIFEASGEPLGLINFTNLDQNNQRCSWGFYLGRDDLPKGTGTIMGKLGLNYAFYNLNMNKVCAEVIETNVVSINFHLKLGFSEEGIFRQHVKKNNEFMDVMCFALFRDRYKARDEHGAV